MSKSPPQDLCWIAKLARERFLSDKYWITDRDRAAAKKFLIANGGEFPDNDEVVAYVQEFTQSRFEAWKELNFPLWGLFGNWNTFAPKTKGTMKRKGKCQIHSLEYEGTLCPKCFTPVREMER